MHWVLDQAATNAYKLSIISKVWTEGYLEFRRALYTKLLAYSKLVEPQLWKDPRPHNWIPRPTRQSCAWCCKVAELRKKVEAMLKGQNGGERLLQRLAPNVKRPNPSWSGCDYCDVPLCKEGTCWTEWHSQIES